MRKDRSYALAVVLGITWVVNIVCLAFHIYNTLSTYDIIALTGTILTGMVPSIARGLNDFSKDIGFPIAIGSLLHIGAGLVGAIFVGLTVGETDDMVLPILAAYSNMLCNGVAHQLFLDDNRQVKTEKDYGWSYMSKIIPSVAGLFVAFVFSSVEGTNYLSAVIHIVAFAAYFGLLSWLQRSEIFVTRFYLGSAMSVISSYAIAVDPSWVDYFIFACVMLLLVMGHWAPTLETE